MRYILFFIIGISFIACKKTETPAGPSLPEGTTAYTSGEIAFVPYASGEHVFKRAPGFTTELTLNFKERLATKQVFAWDQTFLTFSSDPFLEIELRLRYLQTENTAQKSLAIYMPYWDNSSNLRTNLFELPIDTVGLETSFFSELVTFHPTILINGVSWENVFEVSPLTVTPAEIDGDNNFNKLFYNKTSGIIEMDQKNGDQWILHP